MTTNQWTSGIFGVLSLPITTDQPITTSKPGLNSSCAIPSLDAQILQKYDRDISLNPNKVKDLRKLLSYIPTQHRNFYNEILMEEDNSGVEQDPWSVLEIMSKTF